MKQTSRRTIIIGAAAVMVAGVSGVATATWDLAGAPVAIPVDGAAMPEGNAPSATLVTAGVAVRWKPTDVHGGQIDGYEVTRLDASGGRHPAGPGCAGTVVTAGCVETGVPAGTWRYVVRPRQGTAWAGEESAPSRPVTVPDPSASASTPPSAEPSASTPADPSPSEAVREQSSAAAADSSPPAQPAVSPSPEQPVETSPVPSHSGSRPNG